MGLPRLWVILIIMLITLHFSQNASTPCNNQFEGDTCTRDGKEGVCARMKQCPLIYKSALMKQFPHCPCGYVHFEPVVCCPNGKEPTSRNLNLTESLLTVVKPYRINHGAKARAKCKEYKWWPYSANDTLLGNKSLMINNTQLLLPRKFIIKGRKTLQMEFIFMAAVGYNSTENDILWLCGGTLISERFVVTAAHCTYNRNWGNATWVRLGTRTLSNSSKHEDARTYRIIERIRHPWYKQPSEYHDIALLKLELDVEFSVWIKPCCLPYSLPNVDNVIALGWGHTEWGGDGSNDLLKVIINLISQSECNRTYTKNGKDHKLEFGVIDGWQICAGGDGKDTCQGDSGGPLLIQNQDYSTMYTLVGVTSLGKYCGGIIPGIYTNVYHYTSWIEDIVWPDL